MPRTSKRRKVPAEIKDNVKTDDNIEDSVSVNIKRHLPYHASRFCEIIIEDKIPQKGFPARYCLNEIVANHMLDFNEYLNTSSYVNVAFEPEEEKIALMGLKVNLADQTVYPESFKVHNKCVSMIARLWNCPAPKDGTIYPGSTEACLLAGLAMKFRWRAWYAKKKRLSPEEVFAVRPNLVISTLYQACWEKLFKYMDILPKLIAPKLENFKLNVSQIEDAIDDQTIGVVCIMGNHYGGHYDEIEKVNKLLETINKKRGTQVGIHVDAASGGFIAPFQHHLPPWDFRLKNVLSISSSGHKFGESCCGTGWIVWRQRENLSEHVSISVSYLGGNADSYTLNFSRPASGVYNQFYKFLRYGIEGYQTAASNMMDVAAYIRKELKSMKLQGKPRFRILDDGDDSCLPVVAAMLNPELKLAYDDIDLQYALALGHWYVSGYKMAFEDPLTKEEKPLFQDQDSSQTMFRVVVKSSLTMRLAINLISTFREALKFLDAHGDGFRKIHAMQHKHSGHTHC